MSPEALEWARKSYEEKPPKKLTERQERAVNLFGKVKKKSRRKAA